MVDKLTDAPMDVSRSEAIVGFNLISLLVVYQVLHGY